MVGLPERACTPDGFAAFRDGLVTAIPDLHIEILQSVSSGEEVAGTCRATGTHQGSGKPVDFCFGFSSTIRNNKIVAAHNVVDFLTMLQQIDAVDPTIVEQSLMG